MTYLCVVADKPKGLDRLAASCSFLVDGHYLLLKVETGKEFYFYAGISIKWLSAQMKDSFEIQEVLETVLANWEKDHSVFTLRFLDFHKDYQKTTLKSILVMNCFFQILYHFAMDIEILAKDSTNFKLIELQKIKEVEKIVTRNFHQSTPPVKEMAKMTGMSVSKFKLLFHEQFGQSPHQHILNKKMIYANELLQTGRYSVAQVAYKIGYNHPSGFVRIYKTKFNHLPISTLL